LTSLLSTPYHPDFDGCVLFLEEVDEPLYRLDRMLTHLFTSGTFRRVKALMSGSLRGCRPAAERAATWRRLLEEYAPEDAVVVVDLPFGHAAANLAFPIGGMVEVDSETGLVSWIQ
jgi:muramoyltetrapeptide carboxypeptidase